MVQNFSSFLFKRNHLCLNLRHQGGYHPCHHVTWEWGVVRLFEPFLLQLRREAFDFRFRKAHHRTFDGLTVAEACRGGGRERFGSQNVNSYVKIPKMFWVFHLFFLAFFAELNFLQKPSNLAFLMLFTFFFSHIKLATEFVGHLWSFLLVFTWPGRHLAGWFFLCPAGWSSVPWPKFFSVAAGEQRIQTQYHNNQNIPEWILNPAYTCIHVFYFPPWTLLILRLGMLHGDKSWEEALRLELSSAWIVMPMQPVRRKRRCWATSWVFQIWLSACKIWLGNGITGHFVLLHTIIHRLIDQSTQLIIFEEVPRRFAF